MSTDSLFYENDLPSNIADIEQMANDFHISVTDKDIWKVAKESKDPPHLGNVYMSILFSRLQTALEAHYPELDLHIDYEVNALASYFYVNGQNIREAYNLLKQDGFE